MSSRNRPDRRPSRSTSPSSATSAPDARSSRSDAPGRKEQSHQRIVAVAARAIRRAGCHGVGVADIMKEAGLTHGGFYAHFPSRSALVVEAMQRAGQDNAAALAESVQRRVARGEGRFEALVRSYLHDSHLVQAESGCLVAALSSEMVRESEAIRDEGRRRIESLVAIVRASLPPSAGQAEVIVATMVGALQLARTLGGKAGKELLAQTRDALINRYAPTGAG